jgi:TetR/AcrR family fatty acid metabolism transcriptional regulator
MTDRKNAKRQRILAGAKQVFAAKGFENASIRDVARAAGVADGTIYNYFANKDDLLNALIACLLEQLGQAESVALGVSIAEGFGDRIRQRMGSLHDAYQDLSAVLPVILGSPELRQHFRKHFLEPVLRNLQDELGGERAALPARVLLASVLGFQMLHLLGDETTARAWDQPDELALVWARFIKLAVALSRAD